jgi:hypothetical protein
MAFEMFPNVMIYAIMKSMKFDRKNRINKFFKKNSNLYPTLKKHL